VDNSPGAAIFSGQVLAMASYGGYGDEKQSERSRWTPLTRMLLSGEMTQERQKELSAREKFDRWMVNEGYRRM
jgi:NADPH oxidase